jgi:hypothetical protein
MNTILLRALLAFLVSMLLAGAEEISPEIKKIDERLEELKTIWRQEEAIINGYTKNRTVPVREGTAEYQACSKASQRIQQAEAEAKELKAKRQSVAGGSSASTPPAEVGKGPSSNENFAVVAQKTPSVEYARDKHGPKVKDLFIGMSMTDCADRMKGIMETPYRVTVALQDAPLVVIVIGMGSGVPPSIPIPKGNHLILPAEYGLGVMMDQGILGMADEKGQVKAIIISGAVAKLVFKAANLKLEEFVKTFSEAYDVDLEPNFNALPVKYEAVTKEGVAISIQSDFGVTISRGTRPEDTKKAFD